MTEQEFHVIRTELERLTTGLSKAIEQIVAQEAVINGLQAVLESKRLASPHELELAREKAARELDRMLHSPELGEADVSPYRNPSNVLTMGRFYARRCKTRL